MPLASLRTLENGQNYTVFRVYEKVCVLHLHFRYYYCFTFTDRFGEVVYMFKCAWPSCQMRGRVRRRIFTLADHRMQHTCPYAWAGILMSWIICSLLMSLCNLWKYIMVPSILCLLSFLMGGFIFWFIATYAKFIRASANDLTTIQGLFYASWYNVILI